jgi:peptidoglycan/LPS O-acetylase OafA/YrhL
MNVHRASADLGPSANLDFLRSVAVLLVLVQHLCRRVHLDQIGWMPATWGLFGVLLFFVHTCLVLMHSMQRSRLTGWPLVANFATRRVFRIYPLSILAVLAALALHLDSDVNGIRGLSHAALPGKIGIVSNLLLIQNLTFAKSIVNVLWSLPFELQMYAFLPFVFMWVRGKRVFWSLLGVWTASVIAGILQPHFHGLGRLSILAFAPNFLPGVVAFSLPYAPRFKAALWPAFIFALVIVFSFRSDAWFGWVLCLLLGISIPFFAEISTPWLRWISNRVATYSYGIYIAHQFCIWFALGVLAQQPLWLRISVLVVLLVGSPVLLYHVIEKPMIDLGIRLATCFTEPRTLPVAAAA